MLEMIKMLSGGFDCAAELAKYCDEVKVTPAGCVVGTVYGKVRGGGTAVMTHADKPCFVASGIGPDGRVDTFAAGGIKAESVNFAEAVSEKGIRGIFVCEKSAVKVDVGCGEKDAKKRVSVGERFYPVRPVKRFRGNKASGFGLSTALPCAALILAAKNFRGDVPAEDVYFCLVSEGQYDFSRYREAAKYTAAERAVCIGALDAALCGEDRAYVRMCDRRFAPDSELTRALTDCGAAPVTLADGVCAASAVQLDGAPSAQLDLAVKYIGTPSETADVTAAEAVANILIKLLK